MTATILRRHFLNSCQLHDLAKHVKFPFFSFFRVPLSAGVDAMMGLDSVERMCQCQGEKSENAKCRRTITVF